MSNKLEKSAQLYYTEIGKIHPLKADEERKLILRWKRHKDIKARDKVLTSNLRFVVTIARKYTKDPDRLVDLIASGNLGMLNALERYDVKKKFRFLTYAAWWVSEAIHREVYASTVCHIPTHRQKASRKKAKEYNKAVATYGSDHDKVKKMDQGIPDAIPVSMETLSEQQGEGFLRSYMNKRGDKILRKAIDTLSPREQTVLYLYFGLKDNAKNLGQIASLILMSPERVRQIKITAIKSLKDKLEKDFNITAVEDLYD
jgi:RNA polymerase primary sigma factor